MIQALCWTLKIKKKRSKQQQNSDKKNTINPFFFSKKTKGLMKKMLSQDNHRVSTLCPSCTRVICIGI